MSLFAAAFALLLLAQPADEDGPIGTAPRAPAAADAEPSPAPAPDPAAADPIGEVLTKAGPAEPEPAPAAVIEARAAPEPVTPVAQASPPPGFAFDPHTKADGETLQVVLGQRAAFRLDDKGLPVLDSIEDGRLADAHPDGEAQEAFKPPAKGLLAAAVDGSAEKRATVLKVWNGTAHPVEFRAMALAMRGKVLTPIAVPVCPVAAGGVRTFSWPAPIVAVGLARFKTATKEALAQTSCK